MDGHRRAMSSSNIPNNCFYDPFEPNMSGANKFGDATNAQDDDETLGHSMSLNRLVQEIQFHRKRDMRRYSNRNVTDGAYIKLKMLMITF